MANQSVPGVECPSPFSNTMFVQKWDRAPTTLTKEMATVFPCRSLRSKMRRRKPRSYSLHDDVFVRNEDSVNLSDIIQNKTPEQYVRESDMESNGVWASEVEIFVAAALINATVNVYSKFGGKFKWLEFKPTDIPRIDEVKKSCIPCCREAIYLYHKAGSHFDIFVSTKNTKSDERLQKITTNSM